jgi:tetratricopeptide (TPR) repeat protein
LDGVAFCRQKEGDTGEETESMLLEILRIYRAIDGADGTNVAASLYYLSTLYSDRGELNKAENCQRKALDMKLRLVGPVHVDVGACYSNLAHTHRRQGKYLDARDEFSKALAILVVLNGSQHDTCAKLRIDMQICLIAHEKQQKAMEEIKSVDVPVGFTA